MNEELAAVIRAHLGLGDFALPPDMLASAVPGWDSMRHIEILTAIEDAFGIRLKSIEVLRLKNLGELDKLVRTKRGIE
jgi:acyl carrier protein